MDVMVVGIDVSKDLLDVAVRPTGESFIFKRTGVGIEDLIARLGALSPKLVAIEATGGFEAVVAAGLAGAGLPVVAFAQALGKRAKTDLIDAAVIAHFAEATKPKLRQMPDEVTRLLADLVARRRQIVEMIAAEAQRTRRMEKLIKIGAKVISHGHYISFQIAEVAIPRNLFADILRLIAELRPPPLLSTA